MKIVAISDFHGNLNFKIPPCDLVLCGGDVTPVHNHDLDFQEDWLENEFSDWIRSLPCDQFVMTPGNHDLVIAEKDIELPCQILIDAKFIYKNYRIYGSPWQNTFGVGWAFNLDDEPRRLKMEKIPPVDIILSHGPAFERGDWSDYPPAEHTGCRFLLKRIQEIKPKLVVTGHIHDAYGIIVEHDTTFINASLLNNRYQMVHEPIFWELPDRERCSDCDGDGELATSHRFTCYGCNGKGWVLK